MDSTTSTLHFFVFFFFSLLKSYASSHFLSHFNRGQRVRLNLEKEFEEISKELDELSEAFARSTNNRQKASIRNQIEEKKSIMAEIDRALADC
jgi:hypothetical protein